MKVLLIEDEDDKANVIVGRLRELLGDSLRLMTATSLRGGFRALMSEEGYDLILLDMSMPSDHIQDSSLGFIEEPESFAGEEILAQMKLRGLRTPVLVVTQFRAFAGGSVTLEMLIDKYKREYAGIFAGAVYYSTALDGWKKDLGDLVLGIDRNGSAVG